MREKGYYIYYVRNEKMQNYIISRKRETAESATDSVVIKDKTVVENFRERGKQTENRKKRSWGTTAACFVAVCAVSFGALWYISPDTVGQITDRLTKAKHSGEVQVFMNSADTMAGAEETVGGAASGDAYTQKNTQGSQNTEATRECGRGAGYRDGTESKWIAGYISGERRGEYKCFGGGNFVWLGIHFGQCFR